jgi:hypothetical protein
MQHTIKVNALFDCTIERAFKTPLLCDITKVHTGFGFMPRVTHCTDDENWGQIGSVKKVYAAKSWTQKGGFISTDKILERQENSYWKFEVSNFQSWMLGFTKFVGEWRTTEIAPNTIAIDYIYTLHYNTVVLYPLQILFAKVFWKIYMQRVLKNVKHMIENNESYQYA